jgi:hypothetical protein
MIRIQRQEDRKTERKKDLKTERQKLKALKHLKIKLLIKVISCRILKSNFVILDDIIIILKF